MKKIFLYVIVLTVFLLSGCNDSDENSLSREKFTTSLVVSSTSPYAYPYKWTYHFTSGSSYKYIVDYRNTKSDREVVEKGSYVFDYPNITFYPSDGDSYTYRFKDIDTFEGYRTNDRIRMTSYHRK